MVYSLLVSHRAPVSEDAEFKLGFDVNSSKAFGGWYKIFRDR